MHRDSRFEMRLGDLERRLLDGAAAIEQVPLSTWLREIAVERAREVLAGEEPES